MAHLSVERGLTRAGVLLTVCFVAFATVTLGSVAFGQIYTASINGTVRDASGSVVPNASLVLTNLNTSVEKRAATNETGAYLFRNLEPGDYTLEVSLTGFTKNKL